MGKGFYESAATKRNYNLKADSADESTVLEVIKLLKEKEITVDRSQRILEDAQTILPVITKL